MTGQRQFGGNAAGTVNEPSCPRHGKRAGSRGVDGVRFDAVLLSRVRFAEGFDIASFSNAGCPTLARRMGAARPRVSAPNMPAGMPWPARADFELFRGRLRAVGPARESQMASISAFSTSRRRLSRCTVLLAALCMLPGFPVHRAFERRVVGAERHALDLSKRAKVDFNDRSWMYQVAFASLSGRRARHTTRRHARHPCPRRIRGTDDRPFHAGRGAQPPVGHAVDLCRGRAAQDRHRRLDAQAVTARA